MKLEIKNKTIISSAHFTTNTKFPRLIINTHYKNIIPDSTTYYTNNFNDDENEYIEYNYYFDDGNYIDNINLPEDEYEDTIKLIAETNEDKQILNMSQFNMHDKNQRIILFIPWDDLDERIKSI